MKTLSKVALASVFALGLGTAAYAQSPQVPMLGNSNPANPVATDGSPLPHDNTVSVDGPVYSGRSAYVGPAGAIVGPLGGVVGTGVDAAGSIVGAGVGVAGTAVDTGLGTAGTVVNGGLTATGDLVR